MKLLWLAAGVTAALIASDTGPRAQALSAPAPLPSVNYPESSSAHEVARRDARGVYAVQAEVNGETLPMVFDTGASFVALRAEDAGQVGIDVDSLHYSGRVSTANGQTAVAPVMIHTLTIAGITRHNIPAVVSKPGELSSNLLGQSFMARLPGYRFEGDRLIVQGN